MAKNEAGGLTKLELKVMQALWKHGEGTVAAVQERMDPQPAYTTVQTMLNILERKGKLTRKLAGRAFVYRVAVSEVKATGNALRDLMDRMFGGSSEELVMSLVRNRHIDRKRLSQIAKELKAEEREA